VLHHLLSARLVYHDVSTSRLCATPAGAAELIIPRYAPGSAGLSRIARSPDVDAAVNRELATDAMLTVRKNQRRLRAQ
jgi:hypothetical protein